MLSVLVRDVSMAEMGDTLNDVGLKDVPLVAENSPCTGLLTVELASSGDKFRRSGRRGVLGSLEGKVAGLVNEGTRDWEVDPIVSDSGDKGVCSGDGLWLEMNVCVLCFGSAMFG